MKDLTVGSEARTIINFALPMLIGNIFQQFYSMVDSVVVGKFVGEHALAAVGTSFPVIFLMVSLIMGLTMGTNILIAQYYGAGDRKRVRATVDTGYLIQFWTGIAITIIGLVITKPILQLLKVPADIMLESVTYLRITFAGILGMFGYNLISAILRGLGDSKTPLYLLMMATLINIVLDLLFVLAFGWGVAGVAWATLIAQGFSFLAGLIYINRKNELISLRIKGLKGDLEIFRKSISIGLPTGIQQTMVSVGMMALTRIINGFGTATIAAFTAASRLDAFASMPSMNLSQAMSTFTGQNLGAGKSERVKRGHRSALLLGYAISILTGLMVIFFGKNMMFLFTTEIEVAKIGARYLTSVGATYILFTTMFINNGVIRGAGEAFIPMVNTVLSLWLVRFPVALILSGPLGMGSDGIWWSMPIGWAVGAVFSSWYYLSGRWKNKAVVKPAFTQIKENSVS